MNDADGYLREAQHEALRARELLAQPAILRAEDWLLVATLLVAAENALHRARERDGAARLPLLDVVLEELSELTSGFTRPEFLPPKSAFYPNGMSASVMGPCVKLPRLILPLVSCFCPWSAKALPHHTIRGSGEPIFRA
jgi:hypothetical protein